MSKKTIYMIGPLPPPIGGVSIHISRLVSILENSFNVNKIDTSKKGLILILGILKLVFDSLKKSTQIIVHNHIFNVYYNAFIVLTCKIFRIKYVQTIHSFRINKNELSSIKIRLILFIIKNADKIIVVSNKIKNDLIEFDREILFKTWVNPAFIPYEEKITQKSKDEYLDNLQIRGFLDSHKILICANAYKIVFYNNEDLYGIDLCIELMRKLKISKGYNIGFIFMLPQIGDLNYFNTMKKRINEYGLDKDFIFINKVVQLVPLFEYVDIFLRPTNTDGDALSIREALFSGIPVISSDIVTRPFGTITFKNRDVLDLFDKVEGVLQNLEQEKKRVKQLKKIQNEFIEQYQFFYNEI